MEYALVASKTFILGLTIHCKGCETKVKKRLKSIQGVHTVAIDSKKGHITISGTIDPQTIISILEKYGKKAVLLWEQQPTLPKEDTIISFINGDDSQRVAAGDPKTDEFGDSKVVQTIHELLSKGDKKIEEIEVTISKTFRVVFNNKGNMEVVETTNSMRNSRDDENVGTMVINNNNTTREGEHVIGVPYLNCCCQFSDHMHVHNNHHWPAPGGGFINSLGREQPWITSSTTTPYHQPIQYDYRPAMGYNPPYQSVFSDENPNGCVIM